MSGQHTPGRLLAGVSIFWGQQVFSAVAADNTKKMVAVLGYCGADDEAESIANLRRFVACWTACEGIDTDDLEAESVSIIAKLHDAAAKRVLAERDKLLEAQRASMDAQIENEALKARLAKSGVAHRQTVAVLTNALRHIEGVALADEPRDLPGIAQTAREALDHWATQDGQS